MPQTYRTSHFLPSTACALMLLALGGGARADALAPGWKLSGFGTGGFVHSSETEADFAGSALKADGAGRTHAWSRHVDSRLGGQLDLRFTPRWSAVVQVVSEQRLDHSYRPRVEWANLKYQATPELALRVGRIALPMFMAADYRKVGYAYPWVRPPLEVYGALPITSSDGADLTWRWGGEALRGTTQALYGYTDMPLYDGAHLRANAIAGLSHRLERGPLSVRASVIATRVTMTLFPELFDALNGFGPQGRDIAASVGADDKRALAASVGLNYDTGPWFVTGEAGYTRVEAYLGGTRSAYLSSGYRQGNFTPYAGYARVWGRPPAGPTSLSLGGLAPSQAAVGSAINAGLAAMMRAVPSQSTVSAGLRWDASPNLAFKLQHERVTPRAGSRGMLVNTAPGFVSNRTAQVTSVALDFVF